MLDTYRDIYGKVLLRCPIAGSMLAQDWVINAFRRIAERRRWSWLVRYGQFLFPAQYNTGTIVATRGSTTITGTGTAWTGAMVGRQFRVGRGTPIYSIASVPSATSLELDVAWGAADQSAVAYQIYQAFQTVPADFHAFIVVWDPALNWQLNTLFTQRELNMWDAQRASAGNAYCCAFRDYTASVVGTVGATLQVLGSGPDPVSAGTYTGAADAVFTVEVTTGGTSGTAEFRWKKDSGSYTSGVVTDAGAAAQDLQDGVQIYWPLAQVYVLGDTWVIQAKVANSVGLPRYEFYPHVQQQYVLPYFYEARATDLKDAGAPLPRFIRGDMLLDMALEECARWPGPSVDKPNPYFGIQLAREHERKSEKMIMEAERQDDEVWIQDLDYASNMPMAPVPFGDAAFWQKHAV